MELASKNDKLLHCFVSLCHTVGASLAGLSDARLSMIRFTHSCAAPQKRTTK